MCQERTRRGCATGKKKNDGGVTKTNSKVIRLDLIQIDHLSLFPPGVFFIDQGGSTFFFFLVFASEPGCCYYGVLPVTTLNLYNSTEKGTARIAPYHTIILSLAGRHIFRNTPARVDTMPAAYHILSMDRCHWPRIKVLPQLLLLLFFSFFFFFFFKKKSFYCRPKRFDSVAAAAVAAMLLAVVAMVVAALLVLLRTTN